MRRLFWYFSLLAALFLVGCDEVKEDIALVATADFAGNSNEKLQFINLDTQSIERGAISLDMDKPNKVIVTQDGKKAYVASAWYPLPPDRWAGKRLRVWEIDLENGGETLFEPWEAGYEMECDFADPADIVDNEDTFLGSVFDMELSADGSKLIVGCFSVVRAYITIYDTATLNMIDYITTDLTPQPGFGADVHRQAWDLAMHPTKNIVYVLAGDGVDSSLRAFNLDNIFNGSGINGYFRTADLLGDNDYDIPYSGAENTQDYHLVVDPEGEMVVVLSDKIYPFRIEADGSLSELYGGNGVAAAPENNTSTLYGKTDVLFSASKDVIYINSAGLQFGDLTAGGGSVCLDKGDLLNESPYPYVYTLDDFINNLGDWLLEKLLPEEIADLLANLQLYGVSASYLKDDTCYMVISPIVSMRLVEGMLLPDSLATDGRTVLAINQPIFSGTMPLLLGAKSMEIHPDLIAVNADNNSLMVASYFEKSCKGLKKGSSWADIKDKGTYDLGAYPWGAGMITVTKQKQ